jgi:hypothetical protein
MFSKSGGAISLCSALFSLRNYFLRHDNIARKPIKFAFIVIGFQTIFSILSAPAIFLFAHFLSLHTL